MENCSKRMLFIVCVIFISSIPLAFADSWAENTTNFSFGRLGELVPPITCKPQGKITKFTAKLDVNDSSIRLENSHYIVNIDIDPYVRMTRIYNKYTQTDCLIKQMQSSLFYLWVDGKRLESKNFKIENVRIEKRNLVAVILLSSADDKIRGELKIGCDDSCEVSFSLAIDNQADSARELRVLFPHFTDMSIGDDIENNFYFFPYIGGWSSNVPYHHSANYGGTKGSIQLVSIFNPFLGGGVYLYQKDDSGRTKTIYLRKRNIENEHLNSYEDYRIPIYHRMTDDLWSPAKGIETAFYSVPYKLKAGETLVLPEFVLGIHGGDFKVALKSYSKWAHTWYKPISTPQWHKDDFLWLYAHEDNGSAGFNNGFLKDGKMRCGEIAQPYDHYVQLAYWWRHSKTDYEGNDSNNIWYKHTDGDFYGEETWGGCAALADEVAKADTKGSHIVLYGATPYMVWKYSEVARNHPDWFIIGENGEPVKEYWGVIDPRPGIGNYRYINMCPQVNEWQDWLAETNQRIIEETKAHGVFLDTMSLVAHCYSKTHKHDYEYPEKAAEDILKKISGAVRLADPQAIIDVETINSDYLTQWIDGSWLQTFDETVSNARQFNIYSVDFFRFIFPEKKLGELGDLAGGARTSFFSGIGLNKGNPLDIKDEKGRVITAKEQLDYLIAAAQLMKENGDAFSSMNPEMLVDTLKPNVFANCFPSTAKIIYTIYNKNDCRIAGDILKTQLLPNHHCVELLYDEPVSYDPKSGVIGLPIGSWEVVCVAVFPNLIEAIQNGSQLDITIDGSIKPDSLRIISGWDSGKENGKEIKIVNNRAYVNMDEYKNDKVIIKLFAGNYLVDEKIINLKK